MTVKHFSAEPRAYPNWLTAELRSDHAGELGAVMIYRGILAVASEPVLRAFAEEHLATERQHLQTMESLLAPSKRSRLQWPWRAAGWLIGALPALIGTQWVYATIQTVETFVDAHYQQQIARLTNELPLNPVTDILARCRADEVMHQQDAAARVKGNLSFALSLWLKAVDLGSRAAVVVARRI
jgi:ubiquinone biosynthesis monooxygenase Coq7